MLTTAIRFRLEPGQKVTLQPVSSPTFPSISVIEIIPQYMQRARIVGVSQALEEFEVFIKDSL